MSSLPHESQLAHEANVVWLEDLDNLDYVRQALDKSARVKPRYARDGRMVGCTVKITRWCRTAFLMCGRNPWP